MVGLTRIVVRRLGSICDVHEREVIESIAHTYDSCPSSDRPEIVEVFLYPERETYKTRAILEAVQLGVKGGLTQDFLAYHDAWTGIPRIHIILDVLKRLPRSIAHSIIVHEVVHTILHGNISSYVLYLPSKLVSLNIPPSWKWEILHSVASSIKDYEVTSYILKHNLDRGLEDYICHLLDGYHPQPPRENFEFQYVMLEAVSSLKILAPPSALSRSGFRSLKVEESVERLLSRYAEPLRTCVSELAFNTLPRVGGDVQDKVNQLVDLIISKVESICRVGRL